jgi:uncharacterized membrane protein YphA (DoxX/SURF4 family)
LFSTFPGSYPGFGLLILRITLGITSLFQGVTVLSADNSTLLVRIAGLFAIIGGALLLIGFLTLISGAIVFSNHLFLLILAVKASQNVSFISEIYVIALAAAIVLLGPGAFSLDAHLFGRREIIIPKKSSTPNI